MSWIMTAGATIFASLIVMLVLTELIVRRGRSRKGLQWSDNSPRKSSRTIKR
jgi:hypothetical protein